MNRPNLSLADIEAFDPQGPPSRRLCPLCGADKPRDGAHRSLSLDRESGLWNCFRCGNGGRVTEKWEKSGRHSQLERARDELRANFSLSPLPTPQTEVMITASIAAATAHDDSEASRVGERAPLETQRVVTSAVAWDRRTEWQNSEALEGTAGAKYLQSRGIADVAMVESGARFCRSWSGRASVVFPISDREGAVVAAQGRAVRGNAKRTFGPKSAPKKRAPSLRPLWWKAFASIHSMCARPL